jgi:hypothetical protein
MKNSCYFLILLLLLGSCAALNLTPSRKIGPITFSGNEPDPNLLIIYQDLDNAPELLELSAKYRLDSVAARGASEMDQILHLLNWTHNRWKHNGSTEPSELKVLTILEEAASGKRFRCVEFGIVLKSVLAANGFKARTLGLKTRDCETTRIGAGHVLTEVWSEVHQKWFVLDAQFNVVPMLHDLPLNAVEFQRAIINYADFKLVDLNGEVPPKTLERYMTFIPYYLYYFDFKFDQREVVYEDSYKIDGNTSLMLVPDGAKKPTVFQRKFDMNSMLYTNSLLDFYRKP